MIRSICLAGLAVFVATTGFAEDWPQWRGVNRDGVWPATGIVDHLPEGDLPLVWSVEIGSGYNGPTVADGRVFVMDRQIEKGQTERILCFDSKTGESLWKHEYPAAYSVGYTAGPRASVTIDGPRAYAVGAMGHFHCLDVSSGEVMWMRDLDQDYSIDMPTWGIAASPIVYGDYVVQQVAGEDGACVVAFNRLTGQEVWRALDERAGYSSPILVRQGDRDVLACWTGESLSGVDPSSGEVLWSHPMPSQKMPIGISTPVLGDEMLFVSSFYDGSLMVTLPSAKVKSELVWRAVGRDEQNTASDDVLTASGTVSTGGPYGMHAMIGTPIIQNGYIYAADSYGQFRCLEAATGKRIWEDLTAVAPNRWATIHMVRNQDRIWMFNEQGELLIATLSPSGLTIHSRAQLIEPTKIQLPRRNGVCWSHPAFAEKSVFARNDNRLVRASLAK